MDKIRVVVFNTLEPDEKKVLTDFISVGTGLYSQTVQQAPGNLLVRLYHKEQLIDEVVEG